MSFFPRKLDSIDLLLAPYTVRGGKPSTLMIMCVGVWFPDKAPVQMLSFLSN